MSADQKRIASEAAAWVEWSARSGTDAGERIAFDRWMDQSRLHREAYADLAALWGSDALGEAVERAAATAGKRRRRETPWNLLLPAGLAAAAAIAGVLFLPLADFRTVETGRGEIRVVALADGSTVQLNGGARIHVRQGLLGRAVSLERGEAYFDVRHDGRSFSVDTPEGRVEVLGTAFNVDRLPPGRTEVSVYRGSVSVGARQAASVRLLPNQTAVLERGRAVTRAAKLGARPDWFDGWFDAQDASLAQLVEEMDRFSTKPVVIDEAAGRTRISGRFHVAEPAAVLELIDAAYDVDIADEHDRIRIYRRGSR